jgi:uncharacterized protein YhaN
VEVAGNELAEARRRLDEARAKLKESGGAKTAGRKRESQVAALSAAVAGLRGSDYAARKRMAERACATHRDALAERMAALRPWSGDAEQLAALAVPGQGDIEGWEAASAQARKQIDRQEEETERLEAEMRRIQSDLEMVGGVTGMSGDQDAAAVRADREERWASHRRLLDAASADAFETALRHDDIVTNARLRHETETAKHHQLSQTLAALQADLGRKRELLNAAIASQRRIDKQIAAAIQAMAPALPQETSLAHLKTWLPRRDKALEVRTSLRQAERDLREAEADIETGVATLSAALDALAVAYEADAGFDALLAAAQSAIDSETELKALRGALQDRERELKTRERDFEKASEADHRWQASWTDACSACWLGEAGESPAVAAVREILTALTDLSAALEKRAGLADRIRKMENDQTAFAREATVIAGALALHAESRNTPEHLPVKLRSGKEIEPHSDSVGSEKALDLAHRIHECLQQARAAEAAKAARSEALDTAHRRQRALAEALAIHATRKREMTAFFDVGSLAEVGGKLQEVGRRADLREQADAAARDILDALRLPSLEEAEAALEDADRAALELELAGLKARFEDEDQRSRDLFAARTKAADRVEAVGGDAAAARIEEKRRTTLLDIEDRARRYLRLRVGIVAAEQALHAYRDQHRSSMMARASSAFRTISRDAYTGLATQQEKDSEFLIAVAAEGGSKVASDLSKGTRFQLYLALRVAGYYEFAQSRGPVPFIADDIMETFDDFRAEEAFRLFAEMAEVGQVIYLTHHRHLCDMAQRIHPTVRIHNLAAA